MLAIEASYNACCSAAQQYQSTLQETWRNLTLLEQKPGVSHLTDKVKEILDKLSCEVKVYENSPYNYQLCLF